MASIPHYIQTAAAAFSIDPALMYAICKVESRCKSSAVNHNDGTSEQKAMGFISKSHGLFQIKLATARSLGFKGKVAQLMEPGVNSYYAAKLLDHLYGKYHQVSPVISAYNAGKPSVFNKRYVSKVIEAYATIKLDKRS